ncbi:IspD/TarI family cytidylyltransferase [Butyrivibrio proteoclasticus]|uniref:IspD/TarI family cytidylyltransferase n=1 Tax=Butyrivibrio proteoclasticus TaxID=43305 RepID=UPI000478EB05|nr:IspD/TarI family cytidylyltransferase [Butyrivibrio proteoclasticus]
MNIAIILAGGKGSRIKSDIPKQFVEISGQMMLIHSMLPFAQTLYVGNIIVVADEKWQEDIEDALSENETLSEKMLGFAEPGENRQLSIYNGLKLIEEMGLADLCENVIIHDAARPFVTVECIEECMAALDEHDGAMPVLPMNDTVYYSRSGDKVDELLNRNCVFAGQAPEAFDYKKYYQANKALLPDKILLIKGSTEPAVMAGLDVALIPGDQRNFKVTTDEDLERAKQILE